jgi:hypothetical protein
MTHDIPDIVVSYNDTSVAVKDIAQSITDFDRITSDTLTIDDCMAILQYVNHVRQKKFKMCIFGTPTVMMFCK